MGAKSIESRLSISSYLDPQTEIQRNESLNRFSRFGLIPGEDARVSSTSPMLLGEIWNLAGKRAWKSLKIFPEDCSMTRKKLALITAVVLGLGMIACVVAYAHQAAASEALLAEQ